MPIAVLLLVLLATSVAVAGPSEDADAAIVRGVALRKQDNDVGALEEFRKAYALSPSPRAAAQMALAFQALGRWVEAEERIGEALRGDQDPWITKNRAALESARKVIEEHVGRVEVLGGPAGAQVFVEQRPAGTLPLGRPVGATAGVVALEVRAPGFLPVTRNISVSPGRLSRETVQLVRDPASLTGADPAAASGPPATIGGGPLVTQGSGARPSDASSPPAGWHTPAIWATGIGAVVLGAGGAVALVIRSDKGSQLARKLEVGRCMRVGNDFFGMENRACADLASSKETWTWVAAGAFVAAGAAAVTAGVLFATRNRGDADTQTASNNRPNLTGGLVDGKPYLEAVWRF